MEKLLNEILDKLNFLMANTYLMIGKDLKTVMDLYSERKKLERPTPTEIELKYSEDIAAVKKHAFSNNQFKISEDRKWVIVEDKYHIYKIPYELWIR